MTKRKIQKTLPEMWVSLSCEETLEEKERSDGRVSAMRHQISMAQEETESTKSTGRLDSYFFLSKKTRRPLPLEACDSMRLIGWGITSSDDSMLRFEVVDWGLTWTRSDGFCYAEKVPSVWILTSLSHKFLLGRPSFHFVDSIHGILQKIAICHSVQFLLHCDYSLPYSDFVEEINKFCGTYNLPSVRQPDLIQNKEFLLNTLEDHFPDESFYESPFIQELVEKESRTKRKRDFASDDLEPPGKKRGISNRRTRDLEEQIYLLEEQILREEAEIRFLKTGDLSLDKTGSSIRSRRLSQPQKEFEEAEHDEFGSFIHLPSIPEELTSELICCWEFRRNFSRMLSLSTEASSLLEFALEFSQPSIPSPLAPLYIKLLRLVIDENRSHSGVLKINKLPINRLSWPELLRRYVSVRFAEMQEDEDGSDDEDSEASDKPSMDDSSSKKLNGIEKDVESCERRRSTILPKDSHQNQWMKDVNESAAKLGAYEWSSEAVTCADRILLCSFLVEEFLDTEACHEWLTQGWEAAQTERSTLRSLKMEYYEKKKVAAAATAAETGKKNRAAAAAEQKKKKKEEEEAYKIQRKEFESQAKVDRSLSRLRSKCLGVSWNSKTDGKCYWLMSGALEPSFPSLAISEELDFDRKNRWSAICSLSHLQSRVELLESEKMKKEEEIQRYKDAVKEANIRREGEGSAPRVYRPPQKEVDGKLLTSIYENYDTILRGINSTSRRKNIVTFQLPLPPDTEQEEGALSSDAEESEKDSPRPVRWKQDVEMPRRVTRQMAVKNDPANGLQREPDPQLEIQKSTRILDSTVPLDMVIANLLALEEMINWEKAIDNGVVNKKKLLSARKASIQQRNAWRRKLDEEESSASSLANATLELLSFCNLKVIGCRWNMEQVSEFKTELTAENISLSKVGTLIYSLEQAISGTAYHTLKCTMCKSGSDPNRMLLCDSCDNGFHIFCLRPKLLSIPTGNWFCSACKSRRT